MQEAKLQVERQHGSYKCGSSPSCTGTKDRTIKNRVETLERSLPGMRVPRQEGMKTENYQLMDGRRTARRVAIWMF